MRSTTFTSHFDPNGPPTLRLVHVREGTETLDVSGAHAAGLLRADEYINHRGWIAESGRNQAGAETDGFDNASSHFAVLAGESVADVTAVGVVRLVRPVEGALPIHDSFPELAGLADGYTEVSRYIARDRTAALVLRAVIVGHLLGTDTTGIAIISDGLCKLLGKQSLILRHLAEPRVVPTYGRRPQVAVEIDAAASAEQAPIAHLVERAVAKDWAGLMANAMGVAR